MRTTIDRAGRIVVPKAMRDAMGLGPGGKVDIVFEDGRLTIEAAHGETWVEIAEDGFPIIRYAEEPEPLSGDDVRDLIESTREERLDHLAGLV
ncbi:MAG: AbrB/MazE/SpoVT family DNA-binding domain-containing protein [Nocardiaceae bacterium]|nr:AbrB/MazE/SpoVT family DNA-binding domain-containing protein [Nocardiaceae bacterium]